MGRKEKIIGIYKITNPKGKVYVGQSIDIIRRWQVYKKKRTKSQPRIFYSLEKYGWDSHIFEVLEECNKEKLHEREIYWKKFYLETFNNDWDKVLFCDIYDRGGGERSEQTKRKISEKTKGKKLTQETKDKISEANKGTIFPPEIRILMGRKKGSTYSEEDRKKISDGLKGKPKPEGFGEKIRAANTGREKTEEWVHHLQQTHPNKKAIYQIDPQTNKIINEFSSMKEAGRVLNINPNGITEVIRGRQVTSFGFIWRLKE